MKTRKTKAKGLPKIEVSKLLTYLISLLKSENENIKKEFDSKKKEYEMLNIPFNEKIKYITSMKLQDFISLASQEFGCDSDISTQVKENWKTFSKYLEKSYEEMFEEISLVGNFYKDLKQYLMLLKAYGKKVVSCRQAYKMLGINSYLDINDNELEKAGIKTIWIYKNPYYTLS